MESRLITRPFASVWASTFGFALAIGMLFPILPLYAKGPLGAGNIGVGLIIAAAAPAAILVQPLAGRFGDRHGRKPLLVTGLLAMAAMVALLVPASSPATVGGLRVLAGFGEGLVFVASATIVNDLAPDERRGEAVSLYSLAVWGGLAAGPPVGELLLGDESYDAVWLAAATCVLTAALVAATLPETRPASAGTRPAGRIFQHSALLPGAVLLVALAGFGGMATFAPLYARELGLSGAGLLFAMNAVIVIGIRLLGRRIPDRFGARRAATTAVGFSAAGLGLIALVHSPAGLYGGAAVLAVGQALVFPSLMLLVVNRAPEAERSAAVGTFSACAELGYAVGAVGLGAVAATAGYRGVFAVGALVVAAGLLPLSRLRSDTAVSVPAPATADTPR